LSLLLDADRTLVMKSGYFARSGPANAEDRVLINRYCTVALRAALNGSCGIVGGDAEDADALGLIGFERIHGGRRLDPTDAWVQDVLARVEEPQTVQ
jgi:pyrophosphate--fructose-6-phosphate 1-phosphotransferase